jgi:hypothetical protein
MCYHNLKTQPSISTDGAKLPFADSVCVCVGMHLCACEQEYPRAKHQAEGSKSQPSDSPNLITQIF